MHTTHGSTHSIKTRELDLELRDRDLRRREAALKRLERSVRLGRVPAGYFEPARYQGETDWWAKQLGPR